MLGISRHAQISKISGFSVNILKKKHSATEMASALLQSVVPFFFSSFFPYFMIITCTHHRLQSASIVSKCLATAVESGEWMMNWKKKGLSPITRTVSWLRLKKIFLVDCSHLFTYSEKWQWSLSLEEPSIRYALHHKTKTKRTFWNNNNNNNVDVGGGGVVDVQSQKRVLTKASSCPWRFIIIPQAHCFL